MSGFDLSNGEDTKVKEEVKEDESKSALGRGLDYYQVRSFLRPL